MYRKTGKADLKSRAGDTFLTAAIAVLGAALVLGRELTFGAILAPDSAHYIAAARSLLAGEGLLAFHGRPLTSFPPLYPLLLAAASLGIFDPLDVAGPLNAVIFGLTVFAVGRYLRQCLESWFLAAWGCLATALATPLTSLSSHALSDSLFILLLTLALIQTDRFLTEGRLRALIWTAVFSALAWQTRYIGVAVPAFVGLLLLFHTQAGTSLPQRVRRVTAYSLIVAVPMALWLLRNYLATGELTPHPPPGDYPVSMMLRDSFGILWSFGHTWPCQFLELPYWPLFDEIVFALLAITAALLAPVVCILVVVQRRRLTVIDWRPCWLFGGFALMYLVLFIAIISLLVGISMVKGVSWRLVTPLYIPLLIAGVFVLDRIFSYERERRLLGNVGSLPIFRTMMPGRKGSVLVAIVTIVLSLGVARQIVPATSTIMLENCHYYDLQFNKPRWSNSETLRYVRENLVAVKIWSNRPEPLSLHIGRHQNFEGLPYTRAKLNRYWSRDDAYVVWFYDQRTRDYSEADLRSLPGLEPVAELADSFVFKVKPASSGRRYWGFDHE